MFSAPLRAGRLAWVVMNGVWRKWTAWRLSCFEMLQKTASGRAFESLLSSLDLPIHTFPNEHPWEFCSLYVAWMFGEMA